MRRLFVFLLSLAGLATALVTLPIITTSAGAAARPVTAALQQIPLTGVAPGGRRTAALGAALHREATLESTELSTRPYSLMGVTWDLDPFVDDVQVYVRNREQNTGGWSDWEAVEANPDLPDAGSQDVTGPVHRSGTVPIWTGPSNGVQVRVDRVSGAAPTGVKIELIDPGISPADGQPAAPRASAHAGQARPEIITRAEWGADESIRRGTPTYNSTVKVGFVHHTAGSNNYSPDQAASVVRGVYAYHVKSNGWSDIGYNYLVDRYGRAYEGRAGGLDKYVFGSHTGGFNTNTFAVSLMGDFTTAIPPAEMLTTASKLLAWKLGSAYRDPKGTTTLVSAGGGTSKYRAGTSVPFEVVSGHRDAGNTSCPGAQTYARMGLIRDQVEGFLGAAFADPAFAGGDRFPLGTSSTVGLQARALGDTSWTGTVATARGDVVREVSGTGGDAELAWDLTDASGAPARPGAYVLRLTGTEGDDAALPVARTVVVSRVTCRGTPLERARCTALQRGVGLARGAGG